MYRHQLSAFSALVLTAIILFAAPAAFAQGTPTPPAAPTPTPTPTTTISGIIVLNSTDKLPSGAIVTIQLADITTPGAPAKVISESAYSTGDAQSPFAFRLSYDPTKIDTTHRYSIQGNIRVAGQTVYSTIVAYPVITFSSPVTDLRVSMNKLGTTIPQSSAGTQPLLFAAVLLLAGVGVALLRRKFT